MERDHHTMEHRSESIHPDDRDHEAAVIRRSAACCLGAACLAVLVSPSSAQGPDDLVRAGPIEGYHTRPARAAFEESMVENLALPEGFSVHVYASGLGAPRMMAVHGDTVYVTRRESGDVIALRDTTGDGRADETIPVAADLPYVHGIEVVDDRLLVVTDVEMYSLTLAAGSEVGQPERVIDNLPDAGQHPNRTLELGPDGVLYLSIGSTCNACDEPNPEHATLQQVDPTSFARVTFAEGLRNTIGFDWHPDTGELWGMDHQTDMRGDDRYPEELNRISAGGHYGWPFCWGEREVDEMLNASPEGTTKDEFCAATEPMVMGHQAHAAPLDLLFYSGDSFPTDYRGDAFVTLHGSWNRSEPVGYAVFRIAFDGGQPVAFEEFLGGFLSADGSSQFGRPVGLGVLPDGSLLISEDANGVIYRVVFDGN